MLLSCVCFSLLITGATTVQRLEGTLRSEMLRYGCMCRKCEGYPPFPPTRGYGSVMSSLCGSGGMYMSLGAVLAMRGY